MTEYKFQGICSKLKKARLPSRPALGNSIKSTAWTCPELFGSFKLMHTISETKKNTCQKNGHRLKQFFFHKIIKLDQLDYSDQNVRS